MSHRISDETAKNIAIVARYLKDHPEFSLRRIEEELGIYHTTISRYRKWINSGDIVVDFGHGNGEPVTIKQGGLSVEVQNQSKVASEKTVDVQTTKDLHQSTEEKLRSILAQVPVLEATPRSYLPDNADNSEAVVMLDISDVHAGQKIRREDVSGINEYNPDIFIKRGERLLERTWKIVRAQRQCIGDLTTLHINWIGDIIDGEGIYRGQERDIVSGGWEQIIRPDCGDWFAHTFLPGLLDCGFKTIINHCVRGNHGRLGRPGALASTTNLDLMFYDHMMHRTSQRANQISWLIATGTDQYYRLFGRIHMVSHGESIKGWAGIPWYGVNRFFNSASRQWSTNIWALHLGHHHRSISIPTENSGFIAVGGCWSGVSELAANVMRAGDLPCQSIRFLDKEHGLISEHRIWLADPTTLPEGEGILTPCFDAPIEPAWNTHQE
jgi:hypothetical protein